MAGLTDIIGQSKQFWASRSARQKGFLLGGAAATVLILLLLVRMIGTPDYKPLFTGLEAADSQSLSAQLEAKGIPHQTSPDGKTISVPADKIDAARLEVASQDKPHSGRMGFEIFDKMSWGQTEFDEKVSYQRALEGELERTIQTLKNVDSARVHIVMSTDSVFIDRQRAAKASVILKLKRGTLSKDAVLAIARLVSGAIDELKPEDVSIVDADSNMLLGPGRDGQGGDGSVEANLTQRLVSTLGPVVGADRIRASVNVEYDQGTTEESQEKYDPAVSVPLTVQRTEEQVGGEAISAGVPGTGSNIPAPKSAKPVTASTASNGTQTSKSESATYGVNRVVLHTMKPAGGIRRLTAAILVDDAQDRHQAGGKTTFTSRKRSAEELRQIQELAQAAIGFDTARGDTISVQNLSFEAGPVASDVEPPSRLERVRKTVIDFSSVLRPIGLLALFVLAYLLVLRPIQKQAMSMAKTHVLAIPVQAALPKSEHLAMGSPENVTGANRAIQLKAQTVELIKEQPVNTTRALQSWLNEETS